MRWDKARKRCLSIAERGYAVDNGLRKLTESLSRDGSAICGNGLACVTAFADALNEWNLAQQRQTKLFGQLLAAIAAENVVTVLREFSRCEPGHVLYEAENGYADFFVLVHVNTLASICKGHLLGSAHDDGSSDVELLKKCEMNVAGAWRRVNDEVVEFAPVCL